MVKRRERRVGGCENSIIEECIWSKRGMERAVEFWWFRRNPKVVRLPLLPLRCQRQLRRRQQRVSIMNVAKCERDRIVREREN